MKWLFMSVLSTAASPLHRQRWVVATDTVNLKILNVFSLASALKIKSTDLLFRSGAVPFQIMLVFIVPFMTFFFVINAFSVAYDFSQKLMEAGNEPISEFPQNGNYP